VSVERGAFSLAQGFFTASIDSAAAHPFKTPAYMRRHHRPIFPASSHGKRRSIRAISLRLFGARFVCSPTDANDFRANHNCSHLIGVSLALTMYKAFICIRLRSPFRLRSSTSEEAISAGSPFRLRTRICYPKNRPFLSPPLFLLVYNMLIREYVCLGILNFFAAIKKRRARQGAAHGRHPMSARPETSAEAESASAAAAKKQNYNYPAAASASEASAEAAPFITVHMDPPFSFCFTICPKRCVCYSEAFCRGIK